MKNHYELTETAFETQFKNCELDPSIFSHEAHLRLAWIHITKYGAKQAEENIHNQLLTYVKSLGAEGKYNKTNHSSYQSGVSFYSKINYHNF